MLLPECQLEIMSAIWQATADHGSAFFRDLYKYGHDHLWVVTHTKEAHHLYVSRN